MANDNNHSFATDVAKKRIEQFDLTQEELAGMVGISTATVKNIERGKFPGTLRVYLPLCWFLGLNAMEYKQDYIKAYNSDDDMPDIFTTNV